MPTSEPGTASEPLRKSIAVIGAGASGLCTAKYLREAGFSDIAIFEIGSQIGGMWCYENDNGRSSAYKTLHINTARNLTNFSDYPFDDTVQFFPSHWDMHRYLISYAEHFDLVRHIRFNSQVMAVEPLYRPYAEQPRWRVTLHDGSQSEFDSVIVATGHLTTPYDVPEFKNFAGQYLHSHYYREPAPFVGKRICVVGAGNSAMDIASDVCVTSPRTVLVARSGVMIAPKLFMGYPFTDVSMHLYRDWIPDFVRRRLLGLLIYIVNGRMTDLGFKPLTKRSHPTSNANIVQHIAYRRVQVKQGIDSIEGRTIRFVDGSSEDFDVLIAATGYLIDLPFLSPDVLPVENNQIDLYKRMVVPEWPGLYFVGMFNTTTALNLVFEHQAKWLCEVLLERAALPSTEEMNHDIEAKKRWIAENYQNASPRHMIEEEHLPYFRELRSSMRKMQARARRSIGMTQGRVQGTSGTPDTDAAMTGSQPTAARRTGAGTGS